MNAVAALNTNLPKVPVAKFEPILVAASNLAESLRKMDDRNAKETVESITELRIALQKDRLILEKATIALDQARSSFKSLSAIDALLIETAINVGRIFDYAEIADFANQDEARLLTLEGLVSSFADRDAFGKTFSKRIALVAERLTQAEEAVLAAQREYDRAGYAFSATFRSLSQDVAFGRAVAAKAGVVVVKATQPPTKKKVKAAAPMLPVVHSRDDDSMPTPSFVLAPV